MSIRLFVITLLTVALTAGCRSDSDSGASGAPSVGIVQFSSGEETSERAVRAYTAYAEDLGWDVSKVDPQGAVDKAIGAINDFVQKDVDLIVVAVFPSKSLTAGIRAATAAGIPVVSFAGGGAPGVRVNIDAGVPNAVDSVDELLSDLDNNGDLLVFGNNAGLPCVQRESHLNEKLAATSVEVTREEVPIPGQVEAATRAAQAWLAKHPAGSGNLAIWSCFDDAAIGAVSATRQAGRDDVLIYGINGTPAALKAVADGHMRSTAYIDVEAAAEQVAEMTPDIIERGTEPSTEDLPIPTVLVTKESYAGFLKDYPNALGQAG